jgi:hypothetical protein
MMMMTNSKSCTLKIGSHLDGFCELKSCVTDAVGGGSTMMTEIEPEVAVPRNWTRAFLARIEKNERGC